MKTVRCAVYTRKSNEEGLDKAFNSLDAQREAGLDYIKSQKHEGWIAITKHYDDGGFSGGTMKRPALERLLADIERGASGGVDVVVVYKVDRLSRSLHDFARMMQLFDDHSVSFVSVTQQFNTTTSMGRLTLNMLLSFAQFEREVSGERVRDKIAATKKKGYWVCGQPPLGYRLQRKDESRGLYIIPEEAAVVRDIFQRFIKTKSFTKVAEALSKQGHTTKRWLSSTGNWHGGKPLTQKYIYRTLTNPVYIGKITHTRGGITETYNGLHEPLIDQDMWGKVGKLIETQDRKTRHRWTHPHLLRGKLRTQEGFAMSPSSVHRPLTKKNSTGQKRLVRYYVSQKAIKHGFKTCPIKTVNANHLDDLVRGLVLDYIDHEPIAAQPSETHDHWVRTVIDSVSLAPDTLTVQLDASRLTDLKEYDFRQTSKDPSSRPTCLYQPDVEDHGRLIHLTLRIQIKKLDGRRMLMSPEGHDLIVPSTPEPKQHIVDAIGLAYRWHKELLKNSQSIREYAQAHNIARTRILKLLPLTHLSPNILRHALTGTLAPSITLDDLLQAAKHLDWKHQEQSLGLNLRSTVA